MVKRWGLENGMMLSDDCGQFVDIEDYERLEAERDRLKAEVESSNQIREAEKKILIKEIAINDYLCRRHAALVEAASKVCLCRMYYSKRGVNPAPDEYQAMMQSITELSDMVKVALAEVKK